MHVRRLSVLIKITALPSCTHGILPGHVWLVSWPTYRHLYVNVCGKQGAGRLFIT
jgi:hypothetical protein